MTVKKGAVEADWAGHGESLCWSQEWVLVTAPANGGRIKMMTSTTVAAMTDLPLTKSFLQPLPSSHKTPRAQCCSHPIIQMRIWLRNSLKV